MDKIDALLAACLIVVYLGMAFVITALGMVHQEARSEAAWDVWETSYGPMTCAYSTDGDIEVCVGYTRDWACIAIGNISVKNYTPSHRVVGGVLCLPAKFPHEAVELSCSRDGNCTCIEPIKEESVCAEILENPQLVGYAANGTWRTD